MNTWVLIFIIGFLLLEVLATFQAWIPVDKKPNLTAAGLASLATALLIYFAKL